MPSIRKTKKRLKREIPQLHRAAEKFKLLPPRKVLSISVQYRPKFILECATEHLVQLKQGKIRIDYKWLMKKGIREMKLFFKGHFIKEEI